MNKCFMKIAGMFMCLMLLMYITSEIVSANVVTNEAQVDDETRKLLEKKYGLEPRDSFDRLVHVLPMTLLPLAWIFRIFV